MSTSLIQIELGCLPLSEFSLSQDTTRVFRTAARVTKCKYVVVERSTHVSILSITGFGCARSFFVGYIKHVAPGVVLCCRLIIFLLILALTLESHLSKYIALQAFD